MDEFDVISLSGKVTIVLGHFGCGKTNVSVALAKALSHYNTTYLVDYDNVNPYFRAADAKEYLSRYNVRVVAPEFANTNVDIPAVSPYLYTVLLDAANGASAVIDVGGDMLGAVSLGYIHDKLKALDPVVLFVFSAYRPLTETCEQTLAVMSEIEQACGFKITALVNNSNVGSLTEKEDIESSASLAKELCRTTGLPLLFTSYMTEEAPAAEGKTFRIENTTRKLF